MKNTDLNFIPLVGEQEIKPPNQPEKNIPSREEPDPDPTRIKPGVNEPDKIDPTRIKPGVNEPDKIDPTRIYERDKPNEPRKIDPSRIK